MFNFKQKIYWEFYCVGLTSCVMLTSPYFMPSTMSCYFHYIVDERNSKSNSEEKMTGIYPKLNVQNSELWLHRSEAE